MEIFKFIKSYPQLSETSLTKQEVLSIVDAWLKMQILEQGIQRFGLLYMPLMSLDRIYLLTIFTI